MKEAVEAWEQGDWKSWTWLTSAIEWKRSLKERDTAMETWAESEIFYEFHCESLIQLLEYFHGAWRNDVELDARKLEVPWIYAHDP